MMTTSWTPNHAPLWPSKTLPLHPRPPYVPLAWARILDCYWRSGKYRQRLTRGFHYRPRWYTCRPRQLIRPRRLFTTLGLAACAETRAKTGAKQMKFIKAWPIILATIILIKTIDYLYTALDISRTTQNVVALFIFVPVSVLALYLYKVKYKTWKLASQFRNCMHLL